MKKRIMRSQYLQLFLWVLPILFIVYYSNSTAGDYPSTAEDFSILPPYCKIRLNKSQYPNQAIKWEKILGKSGWLHVHHYCKGLLALHQGKYSLKSPNNKRKLLEDSLRDFQYVDEKWKKDVKLRPEMHVKRGEALVLLGDVTAGLNEYKKAMALKPNYSIPYLKMSDYFNERGNREEALKWVKLGLKNVPRSKALKKRLHNLEAPE